MIKVLDQIMEREWRLLEEINSNPGCDIFLYGAGYYAKHYWDRLRAVGVKISGALVDDALFTPPPVFEDSDIGIYPLSELRKRNNVLLIVGFYSYRPYMLGIYRQYIHKVLLYDFSCVSLFRYDYVYLKKHEQELDTVYTMLADGRSRKLMIAYINQRVSGITEYCRELTLADRYFSLMPMTDEEYYVDCGAYTGDTIESFQNALTKRNIHRYKKIVAFEPDKINFDRLRDYCAAMSACDVRRQGVYKESTCLGYSGGYGKSSSLGKDSANTKIELVKLDDALAGEPVSLIKMDIQGAEMDALQGTWNLIERNHPKLAICLAHRPQDLFAIPLLLREMNVDYEYYFCMQENLYSDISLLAIPKK